jgi:hypothetical protein
MCIISFYIVESNILPQRIPTKLVCIYITICLGVQKTQLVGVCLGVQGRVTTADLNQIVTSELPNPSYLVYTTIAGLYTASCCQICYSVYFVNIHQSLEYSNKAS